MLRVVLAGVLAAALLAAAMPTIDAARERATAEQAGSTLSRIHERAVGLVRTEEPTADGAARRHLSIALPDRGFARAPVAYLAIGGIPDCGTNHDTAAGDVVAYRVKGGPVRVAHVPVDMRVVTDGRVRDDEDPLVLRGDARLTMALVSRNGRPTVLVGLGSNPLEAIGGGPDA